MDGEGGHVGRESLGMKVLGIDVLGHGIRVAWPSPPKFSRPLLSQVENVQLARHFFILPPHESRLPRPLPPLRRLPLPRVRCVSSLFSLRAFPQLTCSPSPVPSAEKTVTLMAIWESLGKSPSVYHSVRPQPAHTTLSKPPHLSLPQVFCSPAQQSQ